MDLILWRHAEAEDRSPDLERRLTDKGERQAKRMAEWLRDRLPADLRILVSPAVRARQTADALNMDYSIINEIAPGADAAQVLAAANWPAGTSALLVGHQPTLGLATALLLGGAENPMPMKKGAIFWITRRARDAQGENLLRSALSPDMLKD